MADKRKSDAPANKQASSPEPPAGYKDLRALFINCTLKPSGGEPSHTERLIHVAAGVMRANKVKVRIVRAVDLDLAPGVQPDMTTHGFKHDDWPKLRKKVLAADILVLCTPIWLGEESSVCRRVIERLYGESGKLNDKGQYISRPGWRMSDHRQRGRHQALRDVTAVRDAAPGLRDPATGRCRLDR